jgi:hypothetical protein
MQLRMVIYTSGDAVQMGIKAEHQGPLLPKAAVIALDMVILLWWLQLILGIGEVHKTPTFGRVLMG